MKIFNLIAFSIAILTMLIGCGAKQQPDTVYLTNTKKVYIPVYCNTRVKVKCEFNNPEDTKVIDGMLTCIISQKDVISACSEDKLRKHVDDLIAKDKEDDNTTK